MFYAVLRHGYKMTTASIMSSRRFTTFSHKRPAFSEKRRAGLVRPDHGVEQDEFGALLDLLAALANLQGDK